MNIYISKTNREWINAVTTEREKRKKKEEPGFTWNCGRMDKSRLHKSKEKRGTAEGSRVSQLGSEGNSSSMEQRTWVGAQLEKS